VAAAGGIGVGLCTGWISARRGPLFALLAGGGAGAEAGFVASDDAAAAAVVAAVLAYAAHRVWLVTLRRRNP
jgi:hypothetical protein